MQIDIKGIGVAGRREGSGEPMLLLHGMTTYSFLWKRMIPLLSDGFDLIAPDLLGCGRSDKPDDGDYSIVAQADLMVALLDALGLERVHLVAHDIGGGIAQIMITGHPERFRSLTLISTVGYDYWPVQPISTLRVPILKHIAMAAFDLGILRALVKRGFFNRERFTEALFKDFMAPLHSSAGRQGFLNLAKALDNEQLLRIAHQLPGIPCPVFIVRGEKDIYLKDVISERLHREIKGSSYVKIPTAGHFAPLDEPEILAGIVRECAGRAASL